MTKYKDINGKKFRVIRSKYTQGMIYSHQANVTLDDVYGTYSYAKRCIEFDYRTWASETPEVMGIGVKSHNCFTFTMGAWYVDTETLEIIGYISITPAYDTLYLLK